MIYWRNKAKWIKNYEAQKICKILNYTGCLLILASTVTGHVSISAFPSIVGIPIGTANSAAIVKTV